MQNCRFCGIIIPAERYQYPRCGKREIKYCSTSCIKKAWAKNNKEHYNKIKAKWIENNPEKRKQSSANYIKRNKAYYANYSTLRARKVQRACPKWVNKLDLIRIYEKAADCKLEVDHIIPITNPNVCGLHVPWNLQLLTRKENARKSNKLL